MDSLRHASLYIVLFYISFCCCLAEYDLFPGFDINSTTVKSSEDEITTTSSNTITEEIPFSDLLSLTSFPTTSTGIFTTNYMVQRQHKDGPSSRSNNTTIDPPITLSFSNTIPYKPHVCPEEEKPFNIGPYEVPTQRDLVKHLKSSLRTRFNSYHKKALYFLNDIKEVTRATSEVESKCPSGTRMTYKKCVKHVSNQCQMITKSIVTSLERQRHDVAAFTEESICNFSSMKADPVQLIKVLAMEEASLEFALSGFLRLLSACAHYCKTNDRYVYRQKPSRHMTDQDLVVKHFLTRKNYAQLLNDN